jgi:hypothetical protein
MTILKFPLTIPAPVAAYIDIGMRWAAEEVAAKREPLDLLEAEHLVAFPPSAGAGREHTDLNLGSGTGLFLDRLAPADHDDGDWAA